MKYTKKPKVVEAVQWKGDNLKEVQDLIGDDFAGCDDDGRLTVVMPFILLFVIKGTYIVVEDKDDDFLVLSESKFNSSYSPKKK